MCPKKHLPSYHAFFHPKLDLRQVAIVFAPLFLLQFGSAPYSIHTIASVDLPKTYAAALQQSRRDLHQLVG